MVQNCAQRMENRPVAPTWRAANSTDDSKEVLVGWGEGTLGFARVRGDAHEIS